MNGDEASQGNIQGLSRQLMELELDPRWDRS